MTGAQQEDISCYNIKYVLGYDKKVENEMLMDY